MKIIKNAGATITSPFDSTVRSLLVAIYELGVTEIMIIGHTECGVQGMDSAQMQHLMKERGIPEQHITLMKHCGIDLDSWLHGFDNTPSAVLETVDLVRNHPLVPRDVVVKGLYNGLYDGLPRTDRVAAGLDIPPIVGGRYAAPA